MNTGDLKWFGRSGVPGLGVSVENHYYDVPALKLWDEAASSDLKHRGEDDRKQPRQSLSDKLVSIFNIRRRNTFKNPSETPGSGPKVSVKRSQSMVTTSKKKLGLSDNKTGDRNIQTKPGPVPPPRTNMASDKQLYCDTSRHSSLSVPPLKQNPAPNSSFICQNCTNNSKVSVKRSVSYHERGRKEAKKQSLHRSGTVIVSTKMPPSSSTNPTTGINKVPKMPKNSTNCIGKQRIEQGERLDKNGANLSTIATQTEDHYDYAYSSMMTPAMMIKMTGTDAIDRHDDEEAGNIYEEIIPPDKRLFYSISKGRRENLELYKFADWDLEEKLKEPKTDKDNYIKPREIKSSLNKKSSLRKLKTKEQRNVTFASDEDCDRVKTSLQRSKSVNVSSHTSSKHN